MVAGAVRSPRFDTSSEVSAGQGQACLGLSHAVGEARPSYGSGAGGGGRGQACLALSHGGGEARRSSGSDAEGAA